jgi:HD superfamily phosphodiesterase
VIAEAFKSRIHTALRYRRIDRDGTQQIWKNILKRIEQDNLEEKKKIKIEFTEEKLLEWAAKHFKEHDDPDRTAT